VHIIMSHGAVADTFVTRVQWCVMTRHCCLVTWQLVQWFHNFHKAYKRTEIIINMTVVNNDVL